MIANLLRKFVDLFYAERPRSRGRRLLSENLTSAQQAQYFYHGCFDVVGGTTGRRYRIWHGSAMNVDLIDDRGRRLEKYCFYPVGQLVVADIMLAQKIALESFEMDALSIANRLPAGRDFR